MLFSFRYRYFYKMFHNNPVIKESMQVTRIFLIRWACATITYTMNQFVLFCNFFLWCFINISVSNLHLVKKNSKFLILNILSILPGWRTEQKKKKSTGTLHCKRHAPEVSTWINKSLHTVLVFFLMNKNCQIFPSITVWNLLSFLSISSD